VLEVIAQQAGALIAQDALYQELELSYRATVEALTNALEVKDAYTSVHVREIAELALVIGRSFRLGARRLRDLEYAAILHDIGKIGIPDQILLKPKALEESEWQVMRRHPVIGHEILKGSASKYVRMGALIALGHHEKYDGSGYPNGLVGDHIPLCARIVAVADVYDALTSVRPYKKAWTYDQAFDYVTTQAGKHFDPRMVDAFTGMKKQILQIQHEWRDPPDVLDKS
jgi:two-component system response regulator RpfG